jgi:hypothetical protein
MDLAAGMSATTAGRHDNECLRNGHLRVQATLCIWTAPQKFLEI